MKLKPTKQNNQVNCLAQTGFAAFGKGVQLITEFSYAENQTTFPTNIAKWYTYHVAMISNQSWT